MGRPDGLPMAGLLLLISVQQLAAIRILCVGETLFDGLPSAIFMGGAPLNAAVHLAEVGAEVSFASAVGRDRLGREAERRLCARRVDTTLLSKVDEHETGFVEVDIDSKGDASYTFATPAAWDFLPSDGINSAAAAADAVVWGSLGSRAQGSRAAVRAAAAAARFGVCDVNLRPPFVEPEVVAEAARGVSLLKLNDEEITPLADALKQTAKGAEAAEAAEAACAAAKRVEDAGLASTTAGDDPVAKAIAAAAAALGRAASASSVVVTRGAAGAVLWDGDDHAWSHPGFVPPTLADSVGAGDAFLAALLFCLLSPDGTPADALEAGCRCGAFVASRDGATPTHEPAEMAALPGGAAVRLELGSS